MRSMQTFGEGKKVIGVRAQIVDKKWAEYGAGIIHLSLCGVLWFAIISSGRAAAGWRASPLLGEVTGAFEPFSLPARGGVLQTQRFFFFVF